ncbi:MAG: Rv1355c family protein [Rhodococcus sp. (in: high G+C Gram-positive bacteria)]|uniref:Rv1355c family protein n=1 Tax=Rhodococcus sp. TaxID=1831 RepID=UPI0011F8A5E7|nr:Rv1355c family protein [Rhodococcus sp. (in: high G+C Gram-positive bacteria)]RZL21353.1 MAG: Rv1355c family protein [Rhodococcus sp. (in: high G+C Gram-positive bacteria)]
MDSAMVSAGNETLWRARVFDERVAADAASLEEVRRQPDTLALDHRARFRDELSGLRDLPDRRVVDEPCRWVYYPWRRELVGIVGPQSFSLLRLDRNRNKITRDEQARLRRLRVGIVGLSVGNVIAQALALEGLCGELRLADFDSIDLSNLNRIPVGITDVGVNKAVVAARRVAELDPYLAVSVFTAGVTDASVEKIVDGLDLVVEECDSLDAKMSIRRVARGRGIPVIMETTDRGLLDIERFDLEPQRPLFHGLLGNVDTATLAGLTAQEKIPHALALLSAAELSAKMAASLVEVGSTLSTWPQLGSECFAGASAVATAVRRFGLGESLPSGRIRIDSGARLNCLRDPLVDEDGSQSDVPETSVAAGAAPTMPADGVEAVLEAIRWAPSGGNAQPWAVEVDGPVIHVHADRDRTSLMDLEGRATHVAIGAAVYNAKVAAAAHGILGDTVLLPDPDSVDLVASVKLGKTTNQLLAQHYPAMMERSTNRGVGVQAPIGRELEDALQGAARDQGGNLHLYTDPRDLGVFGDVVGAADRIRYLTPMLHEQMIGELRWPGSETANTGIDIRTLGLADSEVAFLDVVRRSDVVTRLARWGAGEVLGISARDRITSSSAFGVVTVDGSCLDDYVRGGSAAEAVWVCAQEHGLGVQPMSPVFLYARDGNDCARLSDPFASELDALRLRMRVLLDLGSEESIALVLRLSHCPPETVRSARLPANSIRR